ncbi:MAG: phosphatidylserine decarboxylase [Gammaproteobacteria bacterium]|jgi:phosphatidylserine decarboxylase
MSGNGNRLIAREGIPVLLVLLILVPTSQVFFGFSVSLFFILLFTIAVLLFRDPKCEVPAAPLAVLSPATGRIVSITHTEDPWLSRPAIKVRIKISPWDTHILRCPAEGKLMNQWSSNEQKEGFDRQYAYWLQTDEGDDLLLALGMNRAAVFTRVTMTVGERTGQGQRCGFLYFAGVVDVYLPENARLNSHVGDHVKSGTAILGRFTHSDAASVVVIR